MRFWNSYNVYAYVARYQLVSTLLEILVLSWRFHDSDEVDVSTLLEILGLVFSVLVGF